MPESDSSVSDPLEYYAQLPEPLKKQLAKLAPHFEEDSDVAPKTKELLRNLSSVSRKDGDLQGSPSVRKIIQRVAMMQKIAPDFLFDEKWFPYVYCYNDKGHIVRLEKTITIGKHVFVMQGRLDDNIPVIVKWYQSGHRDTQYEIDVYKKLRNLRCPTPWFSSSYSFWDSPVLVMEKLEPLDEDDNPGKVAAEMLRQMKYLHKFGCHNDIKPGNIMKRVTSDGTQYFMIDHGGVALQKLRHGYRRWIWSPKWTCQRPHATNQVTTAKHDFIELGYTWKTMENWKTGNKEIRTGFRGTLAKFMERVAQINERHITTRDYDDLIEIAESN